MMNEVKIDHTKPVWAWVWNGEGEKYKRIYLFSFNCHHYCVHAGRTDDYLAGENIDLSDWDFIEFPKEKKRVPLDAKSCPRRPVLTHPVWGEGVELYPHIVEKGLLADVFYGWFMLFEGGYLINGLPASSEVDE